MEEQNEIDELIAAINLQMDEPLSGKYVETRRGLRWVPDGEPEVRPRGRPLQQDPRRERLCVRLTEGEQAKIRQTAQANGLTQSEWARRAVLTAAGMPIENEMKPGANVLFRKRRRRTAGR